MKNNDTTKAEALYNKQFAALLAAGLTEEQAETALKALKPVRQAQVEMPEARWQLAKALCTMALTPLSDKHTEKEFVFKLFVDGAAMATDAETIRTDIEQFLNKSTFANACKNGKKVRFECGLPMEKTAAAKFAADYITGKYLFLVGLMYSRLPVDAPTDAPTADNAVA